MRIFTKGGNKLVLCALFCVASIQMCIAVTQVSVDGINYEISTYSDGKKYASVVKNNEISGDCIIPETIINEGIEYPVTIIAEEAFMDCTMMTSISLSDSIKTIQSRAFAGCTSLTSIRIPAAQFISSYIFTGCTNLTTVDFGNSQISQGYTIYPFYGCTNLKNIIIRNPKSTFSKHFYIVKEDHELKGTWWYDYIYLLPSLEEIILPYIESSDNFGPLYGAYKCVNHVGSDQQTKVFSGYEIQQYGDWTKTSLYLPETLKTITYVGDPQKRYALKPQLLLSHYDYDFIDVIFNDVTEGSNRSYLSFSCEGTDIPAGFFSKARKLKKISIPFPGEGTIDNFSNFGELFTKEKTDGMRAVTQYFEDGETQTYYIPVSLEELTITEGCGFIPYGGLSGCTMLKRIVLPSSLYMIGEKAFYSCAQLSDIYCAGAEPAVAFSNSFDGIRFTSCKLHVPLNSGELYKDSEGWKRFYNIHEGNSIIVTAVKNIENAGLLLGLETCILGQTANLKAIANSGYVFAGWYEEDNLLTNNYNYSFAVVGHRDLTAKFIPIANSNPMTINTSGNTATLSWPHVENAESYTVSIFKDKTMTIPVGTETVNVPANSAKQNASSTKPSVTFENLEDEIDYYYSVMAFDKNEKLLSQYSGAFSLSTNGLENVTVTPSDLIAIRFYNMQGICANSPWPGLNIVIFNDGSIRKITY